MVSEGAVRPATPGGHGFPGPRGQGIITAMTSPDFSTLFELLPIGVYRATPAAQK